MELYDAEIRDKYYAAKRKLKRLLNELQTADDGIQISYIHTAIDDVICDLVSYKHYDIECYKRDRKNRDAFYMKAASIVAEKMNAERQEEDGKKA